MKIVTKLFIKKNVESGQYIYIFSQIFVISYPKNVETSSSNPNLPLASSRPSPPLKPEPERTATKPKPLPPPANLKRFARRRRRSIPKRRGGSTTKTSRSPPARVSARSSPHPEVIASRRSCEELIFEGKVTVNGSVCTTPQTRVDPAKDVIYVNGNRLPKRQPQKVYLALNKPKGYICSSGENESKSVISLFDDFLKTWGKKHPGVPTPRLFTVGRLDVATTGLIIVTNDGDFAQKLSHPSSNLSKE
ncbi:hypothetical protein V8G54_002272 [Vigna mungo]|uniref:RNA-binding S4 domain-containing protein n=1 Tax=Vigna mungo TaxID=3915 RepID=A0AAQ3P8Y7_VIGMU